MENRYFSVKNTFILIFVFLTLTAVVYWNIYYTYSWDKSEDQRIYNTVRYFVQPLGLWQSWGIFAPPPTVEDHILIQGISETGYIANYTPRYQDNPKFNDERVRKWHENVLKSEFSEFRPLYLQYWCSEFSKQHDQRFNEVTLFLFQKSIPDLASPSSDSKQFVKKWSVDCY